MSKVPLFYGALTTVGQSANDSQLSPANSRWVKYEDHKAEMDEAEKLMRQLALQLHGIGQQFQVTHQDIRNADAWLKEHGYE